MSASHAGENASRSLRPGVQVPPSPPSQSPSTTPRARKNAVLACLLASSAQFADLGHLPLVLEELIFREDDLQLGLAQLDLSGYGGRLQPLLEPEFEYLVDHPVAHPYLGFRDVARPWPRAAAFCYNAPVDSEHLPEASDLGLV